MQPKRRWMILLALLTFSAGLVLFDEPQSKKPNNIVAPTATSKTDDNPKSNDWNHKRINAVRNDSLLQTNLNSEEQHEILAIRPRVSGIEMTEAFVTRNWNPPPPTLPPPLPTAPPLPFSFLGKKFENGKWEVFLGLQDNTYVVKEHDTLNQHYTIDAIHPPTMTITYTPLQQKQILAIGDSP